MPSRRPQPRRPRHQEQASSVDLHTHTRSSDGLLSPTELVQLARERGLRTLAITDHDSVDGIPEAIDAARAANLDIVPGVEINTSDEDGEIHVLGYYVDTTNAELRSFLLRQRTSRDRRAERIVERLVAHGVPVDMDVVRSNAGTAPIGRPHIARALVAAGHVRTTQEAFERWLGNDRPAHVRRGDTTPLDAATMIREAGGVPVLAHPASLIDLDRWVDRLVACGLGGVECYYPGYARAVTSVLVTLAHRYGLVPTGGSDFHGADLKGGMPLGGVHVPPETVGELQRRRRLPEGGLSNSSATIARFSIAAARQPPSPSSRRTPSLL